MLLKEERERHSREIERLEKRVSAEESKNQNLN